MELGIDLIGVAKAAAGAFLPGVMGPPDGAAPGPGGGPGRGPLPSSSTGTQISPVIQTRISPQISPTMVQQQSSPGASVQAAPTMLPGGAQSASVPMGVPGLPVPPMGPPQPAPQYGYAPQPAYEGAGLPWGTPRAVQTGAEKVNWTLIALAGAGAIAAMAIFGKPRRPR